MPRLSRPKRRTHAAQCAPVRHQMAFSSKDVLELPNFLAMLIPYFDAWSCFKLQVPKASLASHARRFNNDIRTATPLVASVSLSQPTPSSTPPQETPTPPTTAAKPPEQPKEGFVLPTWLTRAIPAQLPAALWVVLAPPGQPDKRRLMTVQDFFRYTEEQGMLMWKVCTLRLCTNTPTYQARRFSKS